VANDLRYVRLLDGDRSADILFEAEKQFREDPKLPFRMTYALALLEEDQPEEALARKNHQPSAATCDEVGDLSGLELFQGSSMPFQNLLEWLKAILCLGSGSQWPARLGPVRSPMRSVAPN